ncbi:MAG: acyltransferase [Bacillota bacterium]|nr:acyltransferase [Bacillota bacterium]
MIINRNNNFDLLRLLFALTVFFVHGYDLTLSPELKPLKAFLNSQVAVESFFIISGFLIFMSYENSKSLVDFFQKRLKRIYPAYFFIILFCGFLGVFISKNNFGGYFSLDLVKYIFYNLIFLNSAQPSLPGVFTSNPVMSAVNGSLWTIKLEVSFYVLIPIIVFIFKKNRKHTWAWILIAYLLSFLYNYGLNTLSLHTGNDLYAKLAKQLPGQMSYFLSGALLFYYLNFFKKHSHFLFVLALILYFIQFKMNIFSPLTLAIIVIYFAICIPQLINFNKIGDFSYSIYITHFPIVQFFISIGAFKLNPIFGLLISFLVVIAFSIFSWNFIEKPFLRKKQYMKVSLKQKKIA